MKEINEILIIGGDSKIGAELVNYYKNHNVIVWSTTRHKEKLSSNKIFLDLSLDISNWELPSKHIKTVIFCAANTSIEYCEVELEKSKKVNLINTVSLIKSLFDLGIFVVFLSTNLVFDGQTPFISDINPYNPQTNYGKLKAEAEKRLLQLNGNIAVLRLGKVLIPKNSLINNWIIDLKSNKFIYPFFDMVMSPISIDLVLQVIIKITEHKLPGIFQLSATQDIIYEDVAKYVVKKLNLDSNLIKSISYKQKGIMFSAKHTTFDCHNLLKIGIPIPHPTSAIDNIIKNI